MPPEHRLEDFLSGDPLHRVRRARNPHLEGFLARTIGLCEPGKVFISTDSEDDQRHVRQAAVRNREETPLALAGHTVHFDGYRDLARDKGNTKILLQPGQQLDPAINTGDRNACLEEVRGLLRGSMRGREMFVKFYCLGPAASEFAIPCVQVTDSAYVAHSEDLLYRSGYEEFVRRGEFRDFFKAVHSQGPLEPAGLGLLVSSNAQGRRVYIDLQDDAIYSVNTQYAGNTLGLKKLAMRLGIHRAVGQGWLTEHMFIMGVRGPGGRVSYFTGAYPSMCGKTSTAMLEGEQIVGDDIAYLRKMNGEVRAVNVEKGMFGIIDGVNEADNAGEWKALTSPGPVIFSNVLIDAGKRPYWTGMGVPIADSGTNHWGEWKKGDRDPAGGNEIPPSHKNARFTFPLDILDNLDLRLEDPCGVEVSGIIYGARDSDTLVPVEEAFDWEHGIVTKGAALESETTAATIGKEGVKSYNPMSNLDFLSVPIGRYIEANLRFGANLSEPPRIYSVNYFLRGPDGKFLTGKDDKKVWLKWMELRAHGEAGALRTPTGLIPLYSDLKRLFAEHLRREYEERHYEQQFSLRAKEHIAKMDRIIDIYTNRVQDTPDIVLRLLKDQRTRLLDAMTKYGDCISPHRFKTVHE